TRHRARPVLPPTRRRSVPSTRWPWCCAVMRAAPGRATGSPMNSAPAKQSRAALETRGAAAAAPHHPEEGTLMSTTTRTDLYARVTARILADLEQGVRPWLQPWHADHASGRVTRPLCHNGTPYRGINILLLWGEAIAKGYTAPIWMTYKQAAALGAHIRKGAHGTCVVYADTFTKTETNAHGDAIERHIPFLKSYTVFNVEQMDGLPAPSRTPPPPQGAPLPLLARAGRFFAATGAVVRHGGARAYSAPGPDVIQLPPP